MKQISKTLVVLITSIASTFALSAQVSTAPIYASVNLDKTEILSEKDVRASAKSDYSALQTVAAHLAKSVDFPFEEVGFRNKLTVFVEIGLDNKGMLTKHYIHNTDNKELKKSIKNSLDQLDKVQPIVENGQSVAKTLYIPLTFEF